MLVLFQYHNDDILLKLSLLYVPSASAYNIPGKQNENYAKQKLKSSFLAKTVNAIIVQNQSW